MTDNKPTAPFDALNQISDLTPEEQKRATEPIKITEKTHPESMLFKITDLLHTGKDGKGLISVESLLTLYQLLTMAFSTSTETNDKANNLKKIIETKNAPTPDLNWEDVACDESANESSDTQPTSTRPKTNKPFKRKIRSEEEDELKTETFKTIPSRRTKKAAKKTSKNTSDSPTLRTTSPTTTIKPATTIAKTIPQPPTNTKTGDNTIRDKKAEKTPPIIIHRKKDFVILEKDLKLARLSGFSATDQKDSLRVNTDNSTIYRRIIDFLDKRCISFHCFTLKEDKTYKIVLKGIPENFTDSEVEDMLREQGFPIIRAQRMKKGQSRTPMALMLLDVAHNEEGKKLFAIHRLGSYNVTAESLKRKTELGQCHNCQMFGHSQTGCRAQPKCVKCGMDHRTESCSKKREDGPATCANCSGQHPANYRGCPSHPRAGKPIKRAANWPALPSNTGRNYEDHADGRATQHHRTNTTWAAKVADSTQLRPTPKPKVSTIHHSPYVSRDAARDRALEELVSELQDSVARSQATLARVREFYPQTTSLTNHGQH